VLLLGDASSEATAAALTATGREVTRVSDPAEVLRAGPGHSVLVIDGVPAPKTAVDVCRDIRATSSLADRPVLVITRSDDVEERIRLLEAGADDVVARPLDERELEARVDALDLRNRHSADIRPDVVMTPTKREGRRLSVVFSPKGGVGTTTVAVNLALALANRMPQGVVIVDLESQVGQVATHLDLRPRQTFTELAGDAPAHEDLDLLRTYLTQHESGVRVLAGAVVPSADTLPGAPAIGAILETLLAAFPVVVVDAGSQLDSRVIRAMELADDLIVVVTPDFPTLKSVHAMFDVLREHGTTVPESTIVLNEIYERDMLTIANIEEALLKKVAIRIPHDGELFLRAVNEGRPIVASEPTSPPARRFDQLATQLVGIEAPELPAPRRRSVFGAILGRS
jgi:pilus assembly protein CpaE